MASSSSSTARFLADRDVPICSLNAHDAWKELSDKEKLYAHWMSKASWAGGDVIREQWHPAAVKINRFLLSVFSSSQGVPVDFDKLQKASGLEEQDWRDVLDYTVQVLSNLCHYRTFGDTKILPRMARSAFQKVVEASPRAKEAVPMWQELADELYSSEPEASLHIGKRAEGHISNYYPSEMAPSDEDVANVLQVSDREGFSSLNTRLRKNAEGDFTLLFASASPRWKGQDVFHSDSPKLTLRIKHGDFEHQMCEVNGALHEAQKYAANDNQRDMLGGYVESFAGGDIEEHKAGSRSWVKDQGPVVETYIGFIENYVDPYGARAEWEGFVSIVDKTLAARFNALVDLAPTVLKTLPWGPEFENEEFKRPDYSGLTILSFATGGLPAGINIPNYDDVRADTGFKNVSLLNVLNAKAANEEIKFVLEEDRALLEKWQGPAFEVQVANHELLGHGSGLIFREDEKGEFNFNKSTINPLTGKPVESWYRPGETPNSKIGPVYGACEEMRAEAVAMFLAPQQQILEIFKYTSKEDLETLPYVSYLLMARAGLRSLEFYSPETGKHGQAHMQARHGILRWLITDGIVQLHIEHESDGQTIKNAYITVDRAKVLDGTATASMGRLLVELQVRRSLGLSKSMTEFINKLTSPPAEWRGALRDYVISHRSARKVFVQPNTKLNQDGSVEFKDYPVRAYSLVMQIPRDDAIIANGYGLDIIMH